MPSLPVLIGGMILDVQARSCAAYYLPCLQAAIWESVYPVLVQRRQYPLQLMQPSLAALFLGKLR